MTIQEYKLSPQAKEALRILASGAECAPSEQIVQELGKAGLAYRLDPQFRKRNIAFTEAGLDIVLKYFRL